MALNPYAVKTLVLTSGERLPVLIALATGAPLFERSVYVLSEIRATNRASNTIDQVLRSIMVLQLFLDSSGIDIEQRIRQSRVFRLSELDELVRHCKRPVADQLKRNSIPPSQKSVRRISGESVRLVQRQPAPTEVAGHTAANRIRVIRDYLDWLVRYHMARYHSGAAEGERLWNEWTSCKDALDARLPRHKGRNTVGQREGLQPQVAERLLNITSPTSPENPWKGEGTCIRNALLVRWFYELAFVAAKC
ncbi:hypothetical protein [Pseudomonas syringae]|uniref:hypothetical protein n=1 Tax=Pseudomonas syringae TaxID=317 RepID=UPI000A5DBD9B|nr:hypothetical protein [Pseudomonas syringae]